MLASDSGHPASSKVRRVVIIGCAVNLILMALKLATGYLGHSDALFADGFHSLNDVAADLLMLFFVGLSYRKANEKFPYGYGKFETFSSFLISGVLIVIALVIGFEGVESIVSFADGEELPQPDVWTVVVIVIAMASKEFLFRYYSSAARKIGSTALAANAWHHRSDALASVATLIGVSFAHFFGPSFRILDPCASIVIALFIFVSAGRIIVPAFAELMDRSAPTPLRERCRAIILSEDGVRSIRSMKVRRSGHYLIVVAEICIDPQMTVGEGAQIARRVEEALRSGFHRALHPTVVTVPAQQD